MNFSYSIDVLENCRIINLTGNLNALSNEAFERLLRNFLKNDNIILNMESLEIISSSGINALIDMTLEARDHSNWIFLLKPRRNFLQMLEVLNVYEYFVIIETIEEGLVKLKHYS